MIDLLFDALGPDSDSTLSGPYCLSLPSEVARTCKLADDQGAKGRASGLAFQRSLACEVVDHRRLGRDYFLLLSSVPRQNDGLRHVWLGKVQTIIVAPATCVRADQTSNSEHLAQLSCITALGIKMSHTIH